MSWSRRACRRRGSADRETKSVKIHFSTCPSRSWKFSWRALSSKEREMFTLYFYFLCASLEADKVSKYSGDKKRRNRSAKREPDFQEHNSDGEKEYFSELCDDVGYILKATFFLACYPVTFYEFRNFMCTERRKNVNFDTRPRNPFVLSEFSSKTRLEFL